MKARLYIFLLFVFLFRNSSSASAQSNEIIDRLLEEERATWGKTAYLVLSAARIIPEDATEEQALEALKQTGWKLKLKGTEEPIQLGWRRWWSCFCPKCF